MQRVHGQRCKRAPSAATRSGHVLAHGRTRRWLPSRSSPWSSSPRGRATTAVRTRPCRVTPPWGRAWPSVATARARPCRVTPRATVGMHSAERCRHASSPLSSAAAAETHPWPREHACTAIAAHGLSAWAQRTRKNTLPPRDAAVGTRLGERCCRVSSPLPSAAAAAVGTWPGRVPPPYIRTPGRRARLRRHHRLRPWHVSPTRHAQGTP
jgi:hypothetical protein